MQQTLTPTKQHNLSPAYLDGAAAEELHKLTATELMHLRTELLNDAALLKSRSDVLQGLIAARYLDKAKAQLRSNGMDCGTTHVFDDEVDIVINVPKSVAWDQAGLMAELNNMPKEDARHYGDLTVKVSETNYKGAPPGIKRQLDKHRTVKPGTPKIELKPIKKKAA